MRKIHQFTVRELHTHTHTHTDALSLDTEFFCYVAKGEIGSSKYFSNNSNGCWSSIMKWIYQQQKRRQQYSNILKPNIVKKCWHQMRITRTDESCCIRASFVASTYPYKLCAVFISQCSIKKRMKNRKIRRWILSNSSDIGSIEPDDNRKAITRITELK